MKFGMIFANVGPLGDPENAAALGQISEEHGIESVWTVEHVIVPGRFTSTAACLRPGRDPRRTRSLRRRRDRQGRMSEALS